jgi:hypothetical protein
MSKEQTEQGLLEELTAASGITPEQFKRFMESKVSDNLVVDELKAATYSLHRSSLFSRRLKSTVGSTGRRNTLSLA